MKSPIITDNSRRAKTNPDQSSLISYSTVKSCASSERKTQVKVACKVLCEMREDESSKLAMKFTQLRIVLATQSLLHKLQKYKSSKLQTYFWILQQERKTIQHNSFLDLNQTISLTPVMDDLQNNQIREQIQQDQYPQISTTTVIVLFHLLKKLINQQQKLTLKKIKAQSNFCKGITQITNLIKNYQKRSYYLCIFNLMRCNQNKKVLKTSVLDQNQEIPPENQMEEEISQQQEEMSMKEQLAIKFASITIITTMLNEKIQKQQFQLFFNIIRGQFQLNKQLSFSQMNEITQIYEQPFLDQNHIVLGTQLLCQIFNIKLKDYFQEIKTYKLTSKHKNGDFINILLQNKNVEQSINNSYEDLYTQRVLYSQSKNDEEENENEIQILENNDQFKMPCSLQHITDIDDSYKEEDQKISEVFNEKELPQQKVIVQNNKHQDLIKNAVKSYCTQQQQIKQSVQVTPRTQQHDQLKEIQENKKQQQQFYIPHIIGICMIVFIILILQ
ncbi:unnamed protein product [Paramecium pentaurelia]|uniref:Transmembrane protein n=1 Tax=Paramecium pentaurelia TaxID=43138 RepID=A0A8S1V7T7_9CILI|nr:unnamed protein product [Paramecium pentaurelia]